MSSFLIIYLVFVVINTLIFGYTAYRDTKTSTITLSLRELCVLIGVIAISVIGTIIIGCAYLRDYWDDDVITIKKRK